MCSGLGCYLGVDPNLIRAAFVVLSLIQGLGVLLYLVLWVVMPPAEARLGSAPAGLPERMSWLRHDVTRLGDELRGLARHETASTRPAATVQEADAIPGVGPRRRPGPGLLLGAILVAAGAYFLLDNLGLLSWWRWDIFWPAILIGLGLVILVRRFS